MLFLPNCGCELRAFTDSGPENACAIFSSSQYGRTPLHLAANNGILDVVRYLCLMGANVEALTSVSTGQGLVFGLQEPWKLLMPRGHGEKGIAWQPHSKADRLLLKP